MEKFACRCCGYHTHLQKPDGDYNICEVCFWEDDPLQFEDPDLTSGANNVSLRQAQTNFEEFGAVNQENLSHVRKPSKDEKRDVNWKPVS